jgi:hypothetical protein
MVLVLLCTAYANHGIFHFISGNVRSYRFPFVSRDFISCRLRLLCLLTPNLMYLFIQSVPGGKGNILGGHSIGHAKQKVCVYVCPIPNGFRDTAISLYRRATRHVLTRAAKCIDVAGGIFGNVLY